MEIYHRIERKLTAALAPTTLDIVDESGRHVGHAGAHPMGESHFKVTVVSDVFLGKSRVERQRMVYDLLADEIRDRIHALSLTTLTPEEAAQ